MAKIDLTIPNEHTDRVLTAVCSQYGYREKMDDGTPNPETKAQFVKKIIKQFLREVTISYEAKRDGETARKRAAEKASAELSF